MQDLTPPSKPASSLFHALATLDPQGQPIARHVIGMISGTSCDAVDAVLLRIEGRRLEFLGSHSQDIPADLRERLFLLFEDRATVRDTARANVQVGELFAQAALALMANHPSVKVDLVASHGQTVAHLPEERATLQIGEGAIIAARTGVITVSDFRQADMAYGGQGAPLVPFFDAWLLGDDVSDRLAINLGGIANITWICRNSPVLGWDTGPANCVMDAIAEHFLQQPCDFDGRLAQQGHCNDDLLNQWLQLPYFSQTGPKSTGRELFGRPWLQPWLQADRPENLMRTALELTVRSLVLSVASSSQKPQSFEGVVAGGGARNPLLMQRLTEELKKIGCLKMRTFEDWGIPVSAREAAAFALFGYLCLLGQPSAWASVTGACKNAIQGKISLPA